MNLKDNQRPDQGDDAKEVFIRFLEANGIGYSAHDNLIEFESGSRYLILFSGNDIILSDEKLNTLRRKTVVEIIHIIRGAVDLLV